MRANQGLRLRSLRANKISLNSLLKNRASFKSSDFEILTERQAEKTKNREKSEFFYEFMVRPYNLYWKSRYTPTPPPEGTAPEWTLGY